MLALAGSTQGAKSPGAPLKDAFKGDSDFKLSSPFTLRTAPVTQHDTPSGLAPDRQGHRTQSGVQSGSPGGPVITHTLEVLKLNSPRAEGTSGETMTMPARSTRGAEEGLRSDSSTAGNTADSNAVHANADAVTLTEKEELDVQIAFGSGPTTPAAKTTRRSGFSSLSSGVAGRLSQASEADHAADRLYATSIANLRRIARGSLSKDQTASMTQAKVMEPTVTMTAAASSSQLATTKNNENAVPADEDLADIIKSRAEANNAQYVERAEARRTALRNFGTSALVEDDLLSLRPPKPRPLPAAVYLSPRVETTKAANLPYFAQSPGSKPVGVGLSIPLTPASVRSVATERAAHQVLPPYAPMFQSPQVGHHNSTQSMQGFLTPGFKTSGGTTSLRLNRPIQTQTGVKSIPTLVPPSTPAGTGVISQMNPWHSPNGEAVQHTESISEIVRDILNSPSTKTFNWTNATANAYPSASARQTLGPIQESASVIKSPARLPGSQYLDINLLDLENVTATLDQRQAASTAADAATTQFTQTQQYRERNLHMKRLQRQRLEGQIEVFKKRQELLSSASRQPSTSRSAAVQITVNSPSGSEVRRISTSRTRELYPAFAKEFVAEQLANEQKSILTPPTASSITIPKSPHIKAFEERQQQLKAKLDQEVQEVLRQKSPEPSRKTENPTMTFSPLSPLPNRLVEETVRDSDASSSGSSPLRSLGVRDTPAGSHKDSLGKQFSEEFSPAPARRLQIDALDDDEASTVDSTGWSLASDSQFRGTTPFVTETLDSADKVSTRSTVNAYLQRANARPSLDSTRSTTSSTAAFRLAPTLPPLPKPTTQYNDSTESTSDGSDLPEKSASTDGAETDGAQRVSLNPASHTASPSGQNGRSTLQPQSERREVAIVESAIAAARTSAQLALAESAQLSVAMLGKEIEAREQQARPGMSEAVAKNITTTRQQSHFSLFVAVVILLVCILSLFKVPKLIPTVPSTWANYRFT